MAEGTREGDRRVGVISHRAATWLSWSVWVLSLVFAVLSVPLYWSITPSVVLLGVPQIVAVFSLAVLVLAFSTVGALIVGPPGSPTGSGCPVSVPP